MLDDPKIAENFDQNVGVKIVKSALRQPLMTIAKNAGQEGSVVIENLLSKGTRIFLANYFPMRIDQINVHIFSLKTNKFRENSNQY